MKKVVAIFVMFLLTLTFSNISFASQSEFCAGFEEGYKTIKGNMALVPLCPLAPLTPLGSTPYREGIKAGISKAQR